MKIFTHAAKLRFSLITSLQNIFGLFLQAALDLLQELMSHHSTNLQQGMELIRKIHFSKDILKTEVLAFKPTSVIK